MTGAWLLGMVGWGALAMAQDEAASDPPPEDALVEEAPVDAPDGEEPLPVEGSDGVEADTAASKGVTPSLPQPSPEDELASSPQFTSLLDVAPGVQAPSVMRSGLRGFLGLEIRPFSRADLVWVEEERTSGLAVGEFDGTLRPTLAGFGGVWFNKYVGLSANLGLAWLSADTQVNDLPRRRLWAVVRPWLDLRIGWTAPRLHRPVPWMYLGAYGNVPAVRDADEGRNEVEQEAADEAARIEQFRLGGIGVRGGVGVDYELLPGLSLGALIGVAAHRSLYIGGDQGQVSWWVQTDASLLLTFSWGREHADR